MAIKGKKKKSGGKTRTAAPKRPLVVRKPPLLKRSGVRMTGMSLVALIAGVVLGWVFWHGPQGSRPLTEAESARVAGAQGSIEGALAGVGQAAPPANFIAFPGLTTQVDDFASGKMSTKDFSDLVKQAATAAKAASAQIAGVDMTTITAGLPTETANELTGAQVDLTQALRLYQAASQMLYRATLTRGKERAGLLSYSTNLLTVAEELLSKGYRYYRLALLAAGLQPTSAGAPPGISGLPQGQNQVPQEQPLLPEGYGGLPPIPPSP